MGAERRSTGGDQTVLNALAARRRQLRDQAGEVVARGEAVPNEENLSTSITSNTQGHADQLYPGDSNRHVDSGAGPTIADSSATHIPGPSSHPV